MKQYNVIFAGTCRDVEPYIKNILQSINKCGEKFKSYKVIVYENDSKDRTREILIENKQDNYTYLFEDNIKEPKRTIRLARGRNKLLEKARDMNKAYDYLIMLDMDDINSSGMFVKTIDTCFKYDNWDVMTANQTGKYYDLWAFRKKGLLDRDYWTDPKPEIFDEIESYIKERISKNDPLIEVDSAFGGIGVYKLSSIPDNCQYIGNKPNGDEHCEHVEFHKCIKENGGKIFINAEFYNQ